MDRLTVITSCYNQAAYLRQAVESVLAQKTPFPVRLIITDDNSTKDDSRAIIREYAEKYPDRVTALLNDENGRYLKNVLRAMAVMKTEYFTLLDADDYWTDENYLADAVKFLDAHSDYTVYARNVEWNDGKGGSGRQLPDDVKDFDFTFRDFVSGDMYFPQTTGAVFRNVVYGDGIPAMIASAPGTDNERPFDGDVFRFLVHLDKGRARIVNKVAGVYRTGAGGVFTSMTDAERNRIQAQCFSTYAAYFGHDEDFFLSQKHLCLVKASPKAAKNGLIAYTYNDGKPAENYYAPGVMNIGDYVQSLADHQFMQPVTEFVDRDQLGMYDGEPVNMVMNAWYRFWRGNMVFSPKINPLLVAVHFSNPGEMTEESLAYFKAHEPVGCRDTATRDFLRGKGIEAYFSGCMTLTLGRTYRVPERKRTKDVYFVDYRLGESPEIDAALKQALAGEPCHKVYYRSHYYPLDTDAKTALREVDGMIREYARAGLVVTRNIHCALPCLALGTPVIFVTPKYDPERFSGLIEFFNHIGVDASGRMIYRVNTDAKGRVVNSDLHRVYGDRLARICEAFGSAPKAFADGSGAPMVKSREKYREASKPSWFGRNVYRKEKHGDMRRLVFFGGIGFSYRRGKKKDGQ